MVPRQTTCAWRSELHFGLRRRSAGDCWIGASAAATRVVKLFGQLRHHRSALRQDPQGPRSLSSVRWSRASHRIVHPPQRVSPVRSFAHAAYPRIRRQESRVSAIRRG